MLYHERIRVAENGPWQTLFLSTYSKSTSARFVPWKLCALELERACADVFAAAADAPAAPAADGFLLPPLGPPTPTLAPPASRANGSTKYALMSDASDNGAVDVAADPDRGGVADPSAAGDCCAGPGSGDPVEDDALAVSRCARLRAVAKIGFGVSVTPRRRETPSGEGEVTKPAAAPAARGWVGVCAAIRPDARSDARFKNGVAPVAARRVGDDACCAADEAARGAPALARRPGRAGENGDAAAGASLRRCSDRGGGDVVRARGGGARRSGDAAAKRRELRRPWGGSATAARDAVALAAETSSALTAPPPLTAEWWFALTCACDHVTMKHII